MDEDSKTFHTNIVIRILLVIVVILCLIAYCFHVPLVPENGINGKFFIDPFSADFSNKPPVADSTTSKENKTLFQDPAAQKAQKIEDAVTDLAEFFGDTDYKFGMMSLAAGDHRRAVLHFKLATSNNHMNATFNLGLCYERGLGVPKKLNRAMQCYNVASKMGHPKAIYNLGVFYAKGLGGLKKCNDTAQKCFMAAAKLGQPEAKQLLKQNAIEKDSKYRKYIIEILSRLSMLAIDSKVM